MIRVLTIVGARPQFIKASVMSRYFKKKGGIHETILHTGQHYDDNMSKVFFDELELPTPAFNLAIKSSSHGDMTGRMLIGIEEVLLKHKSEYVIVYGDTNSTLAGALAARKLHRKVIHIEAGLRSFNMKMPEEINRILTDRISDILCCPTDIALQNLQKEGFENFACTISKTGDVMEDAAHYIAQKFTDKPPLLQSLNLEPEKYILCTVHREENTNNPERLKSILNAIYELSEKIQVILPLHPRTRMQIGAVSPHFKNLHIIQPVGYVESVQLLKNCKLVITDSGGLQKEAFFFNKFCITMRDETEWLELVTAQCNLLTGANTKKILQAYDSLEKLQWTFTQKIYGGGQAAEAIGNIIIEDFKNTF